MKHLFEIPAPPAARVVSVGNLRLLDHDVDLEAFSDDTLAEVQHVASRVTDDGAEVLVSIVVETQTDRECGQASVPLEWFQDQVRMRLLLNSPDNASTIGSEGTDRPVRRTSNRSGNAARSLAAIGLHLAAAWGKRFHPQGSLSIATLAWLDLTESLNSEPLKDAADEVRLLVVGGTVCRRERARIAEACKKMSSGLTAVAQ
jgi:hypothetical protein